MTNGFYNTENIKKPTDNFKDINIYFFLKYVTDLSYKIETQVLKSFSRELNTDVGLEEYINNIVEKNKFTLTVINRFKYSKEQFRSNYGEICLHDNNLNGSRFVYFFVNLNNLFKLVNKYELKEIEYDNSN